MNKINWRINLTLCLLILSFSWINLYSSSPRNILIEEGVNASSLQSAAQNPAYISFLKGFDWTKVIPISYHASRPGEDDPMYLNDTSMNNYRTSYYNMDIDGIPACFVQGKVPQLVDSTYYQGAPYDTAGLRKTINEYKGVTSPYSISITENRNGNNVAVDVDIKSDSAISGKRLRVIVVECFHEYDNAGTNGETNFFFIARQMLPDYKGTDLNISAGGSRKVSLGYMLNNNWHSKGLYIVAFIQDDSTKEVLQAATNYNPSKIKMNFSQISTIQNPYSKIPKKSTLEQTISIKNPNSNNTKFFIEIDTNSYIPRGWSVSLSTKTITLEPNESGNITVSLNSNDTADIAQVLVKASPLTFDINVPDKKSFYALTSDAKYIMYGGTDGNYNLTFQPLKTYPDASKDAVMLPLTEEMLDAYPVNDFKLIVFSFDFWNSGILAGSEDYSYLSQKIYEAINTAINKGNRVLITSQIDLSSAFEDTTFTDGQEFFNKVIGIEPNGNPLLRVELDGTGEVSKVIPYSAKGVTGDPIGNSIINITLNNFNASTYPYFMIATDIIKISNTQTTKQFLFYDNNSSNIGGVRVQEGNSKIVYMTSNFESISIFASRYALMRRILDWLFDKTDVEEQLERTNILKVSPNPVYSTATIKYSVNSNEPCKVNIELIDIMGQVVSVHANKIQTKDNYSVNFDASNLATGAYFVVAKIGGQVYRCPVVVVR
ncbi:MAG: Choice-of-anchor protein [Ignavibacteria bacterium]|nr:Choice-of-anchor protein [Ignavibacteria bacterium]